MSTEHQFKQLLHSHCIDTGFVMPNLLLDYLTELLSSRLTRVDLIPDPSFAERWLIINQNPTTIALKDYGDTCLFFTALLPEYGRRRGLSMDYYCSLGISSYYSAADLANESCYAQLATWFYHLQKFLNSAIKPNQRLEMFKFKHS